MEIIEPLVETGDILDLGVVDSRRKRRGTEVQLEQKHPNLLFRQICEINANCIGVDIDDEGVRILNEQGYNTLNANVESMELNKSFDTIVAGEIIEHLLNPGLFLKNMVRHLKPEGRLVITTPNPFYAKQSWKIWRYNRPQVHEEHTCWFDPITLNYLCSLSGLIPESIYWIQPDSKSIKTLPSRARSYFSQNFMIVAKIAS